MSKFGLLDDENSSPTVAEADHSFSEKLASFPEVAPTRSIDVRAMDAAAAPHGFVSREPAPTSYSPIPTPGRRRRIVPVEATRHLAIRLGSSQYDRFVAYADRHKLTYHEALAQLLDAAGN